MQLRFEVHVPTPVPKLRFLAHEPLQVLIVSLTSGVEAVYLETTRSRFRTFRAPKKALFHGRKHDL
jgi:hypothetical protein